MKTNTETLEQWIDADQAWSVMLAFEMVLAEKAEHIRVNWQDNKTAAVWQRFAQQVGTLARKMEKANI